MALIDFSKKSQKWKKNKKKQKKSVNMGGRTFFFHIGLDLELESWNRNLELFFFHRNFFFSKKFFGHFFTIKTILLFQQSFTKYKYAIKWSTKVSKWHIRNDYWKLWNIQLLRFWSKKNKLPKKILRSFSDNYKVKTTPREARKIF